MQPDTPPDAPREPAREPASEPGSTAASPYVRIAGARIHAADLARSVAWYRSVLALEPHDGAAFQLDDGSNVEILAGGVAGTAPKSATAQSLAFGLRVPRMQEAMTALESRNVSFITGLQRYQQYSWIYFADPDQNQLELVHDGEERAGAAFEGIGWAGVTVEHFPEMVAWYRDVLELTLDFDTPSFAHFRLLNGLLLEVFPGGVAHQSPKPPALQPVVVDLGVADVDQVVLELTRRGAEVNDQGGTTNARQQRRAEVIDPEGNRIGLVELE
jgi:predicted enzyme related to lactoylglutathione lyase